MAIIKGIWYETSMHARDGERVYFVSPQGLIADLPPTNKPPIINGIAHDGQRVLIDLEGSGNQDLMPDNVGLSVQAFASLKAIFG